MLIKIKMNLKQTTCEQYCITAKTFESHQDFNSSECYGEVMFHCPGDSSVVFPSGNYLNQYYS